MVKLTMKEAKATIQATIQECTPTASLEIQYGTITQFRNVVISVNLNALTDQKVINDYILTYRCFSMAINESITCLFGQAHFWYQYGWPKCLLLLQTFDAGL